MNCKIIGCVSDNAPNMIECMKLMSTKYPDIIPIRCEAHMLNLLVGVILKKIDNDMLTSNKSTEYFFKGWAHKILPESKITMFDEEFNEIFNLNIFEMEIDIDCFPIHTILKNCCTGTAAAVAVTNNSTQSWL
ncbi:hypothetical protein A3Q56_04169 [Intoshia linei]|uniref:DUF659 domain-containing protein n=1 Tax=Intoshia linei TaxID=1819745 RepID=A0A177B1F0_9BILA|nr:hypothetical protein A3Q56_04169 [Intoshia linei]